MLAAKLRWVSLHSLCLLRLALPRHPQAFDLRSLSEFLSSCTFLSGKHSFSVFYTQPFYYHRLTFSSSLTFFFFPFSSCLDPLLLGWSLAMALVHAVSLCFLSFLHVGPVGVVREFLTLTLNTFLALVLLLVWPAVRLQSASESVK